MKRNYSRTLLRSCEKEGLSRVLSEYSERDIETLTSPCGYLVNKAKDPGGRLYSVALHAL